MSKNIKKLFDELQKSAENEYSSLATEKLYSDVSGWIDTGAYSLNAIVGGSIYAGIPRNKITMFGGESSTGKTFFQLSCMKNFLETEPEGEAWIFESESAITTDLLNSMNVDRSRVRFFPVNTVESLKTQMAKVLEKYGKIPEDERPPLFFVVDSIGNLSTEKEIGDAVSGSNAQDMGLRAKLIKSFTRTVTLKLGMYNIPLLLINHSYDSPGIFSVKKMGGGEGVQYSSTQTVFFSKSQDKDTKTKENVGIIIHARIGKGRLTREKLSANVYVSFKNGLNKYYGLAEIAEKAGIFKKIGNKYTIDGVEGTHFVKSINNNPEKYYTKEILDRIDSWVQENYRYSKAIQDVECIDEEENDDVE